MRNNIWHIVPESVNLCYQRGKVSSKGLIRVQPELHISLDVIADCSKQSLTWNSPTYME